MRIGVDTGGTFTDCVTFEGGEVRVLKVFTDPRDPATAILDGSRRLAEARITQPLTLIHGTTAGTNTALERRGARVALLTTAGFEDLIEIGRQNRPRLYDLNVERDPPLVPRALRWGVRERTAADGSILLRPSAAEIERLCARVKRSRAEAVAICFLFSFANPSNERAVARAVRKLGLPVSVSHEILPEFREYERLSTVVMNAYLTPRVGRYLARLRQAKRHQYGVSRRRSDGAQVFVMQSNGGITTAERAAREPVRTILSGPASTDVCLLEAKRHQYVVSPATTRETTLGGLPVAVPVLDVHSVGAGGGSLARLDAGGALRVGPESAGASPGPVCYGRGGTEPTVTDAHLLLGRLDPEHFLGGEFRLDEKMARESFDAFLRAHRRKESNRQARLTSVRELARGIVAVANANMEKALRVISVERGHDPRDFSLISFGGAGGLHACDLARALRLAQVIIPPNPGAFSALGVLLSDIVKDVSQSVLLPVPASGNRTAAQAMKRFSGQIEKRFERLERQARAELRRDRLPADSAAVERSLDLRYVGQSYELAVPFASDFREQFHRAHEKVYGYADPRRAVEVVNLRLRLTIPTPKPAIRRARTKKSSKPDHAFIRRKAVWFDGRPYSTTFYDRARLAPGMQFCGPAVVIEYSSTTVIPPDFVCHVDEFLNLILGQNAR
ncbi:MAG: hydantoinase/oxoprolinase family protein [Acidobacteria bacterium]|nr:hydantoinase/oxoprolinase family protein [Acidobacteriota bacterium]